MNNYKSDKRLYQAVVDENDKFVGFLVCENSFDLERELKTFKRKGFRAFGRSFHA